MRAFNENITQNAERRRRRRKKSTKRHQTAIVYLSMALYGDGPTRLAVFFALSFRFGFLFLFLPLHSNGNPLWRIDCRGTYIYAKNMFAKVIHCIVCPTSKARSHHRYVIFNSLKGGVCTHNVRVQWMVGTPAKRRTRRTCATRAISWWSCTLC